MLTSSLIDAGTRDDPTERDAQPGDKFSCNAARRGAHLRRSSDGAVGTQSRRNQRNHKDLSTSSIHLGTVQNL